jgi:hypothetical protein
MTVNEPLELFPAASSAVQLTVVVPIANVRPDAGVQDTTGLGSTLSVAVTAYVTLAPDGPVALTPIGVGSVNTGAVTSCTSTAALVAEVVVGKSV